MRQRRALVNAGVHQIRIQRPGVHDGQPAAEAVAQGGIGRAADAARVAHGDLEDIVVNLRAALIV